MVALRFPIDALQEFLRGIHWDRPAEKMRFVSGHNAVHAGTGCGLHHHSVLIITVITRKGIVAVNCKGVQHFEKRENL